MIVPAEVATPVTAPPEVSNPSNDVRSSTVTPAAKSAAAYASTLRGGSM